MRHLIFLVILFLFSLPLLAQELIKGQIIDAESGVPLPFASIRFAAAKGTVSDQEGRFSIAPAQDTLSLEVSYVGYETYRLRFLADTVGFLHIPLTQKEAALREVVVYPGENPAHAIIRKAVANREKNNPLNLSSFRYKSYSQFFMSLEPLANSTKGEGVKPDSLTALQQLADSSYLFFNESLSLHQRKNGQEQQTVLASQTAGTKSMIFNTVATDLQPFAFYEDYISLLEQSYLNPLTPNSWKRYDFQLVDQLVTSSDTTFIITFEPQKGRSFRGLKGVLYISSDGYALRNVIAGTGDDASVLRIRIRQEYAKQEGYWFPTALYATLFFPRFEADGLGMLARVRTKITEVEIGLPDIPSFSRFQVQYAKDAGEKDSLFWVEARTEMLSPKALNTFSRMENSFQGRFFNAAASLVEVLLMNRIPIGMLDLRLSDFFKGNVYEGLRTGIGLSTNPRFSQRVALGAYAGWGFQDHAFKYRAQLKVLLHQPTGWFLKGSYLQDLREPGAMDLLQEEGGSFVLNNSSLRNWFLQRLDSIRGFRLETASPLPFMPNLEAGLDLAVLEINPISEDIISLPTDQAQEHPYRLAELSGSLFYRHAKKTMLWEGRELLLGFRLPVLGLRYSQGIRGFGSEFSYSRLELLAEGEKRWRGFGSSRLQLLAGWSKGTLPNHRLFSLRGGTLGRESLLDIDKTFRTMGIHEFGASAFAAAWFQQRLGRIKTGLNWSRPEFVLAQNSAWGKLDHPEDQQANGFRAPERLYQEAGLQIYDLLRINYVNVAYIGIGGSFYYRYGAYAFSQWKENIFPQILLRVSFD